MKRIILSGLVILSFVVQSCDKVEAPYIEGNSQGVSYIGTEAAIINGDTLIFDVDNTPPLKKVLLEDYTGHTCGNCPTAGIYLNQTLQPIYGEQLIPLSVHAGNFAQPTSSLPNQPSGSFQTDFRTTVGDAWNSKFSVSFNPCGMVNRVDYPTSQQLKLYQSWRSTIDAQLQMAPEFKVRLKSTFDALNQEAHIAVQTQNVAAVAGDYKLQVVVAEDSVVDWQEWYGHTPEYEPNYLHRHVLRGTCNSNFGELIYSGTINTGTIAIRGYSFPMSSAWVTQNCRVIAFLYDASTEEILQVEEVQVME